MFTNVDKDIAAVERAMAELVAQAQKGFKNTSEVDQFAKKIEKLDLAFSKIGSQLDGLNITENFSDTSKELEKIKRQINEIVKKNADLKKSAMDVATQEGKTVFAKEEYKRAVQDAIEKQKDLKKVLEDINKEQSQIAYNTMKNQFDKGDQGKATASILGTEKQNLALGSNVSDEFVNKYKKALNEIIVEGKEVDKVFDELNKDLNESDKEYAESAQFAEDYAKNLAAVAKEAAKAAGTNIQAVSGAAKKATALGSYSANGDFYASANTQALITYNNAQREAITLGNQRAAEENRIAEQAEQNEREINQGLINQRNLQQGVIDEQRDAVQATKEQVVAQQGLNDVFERMSNSVKQFFSIGTALSTVRKVVTETFNDVQNLDKAFGSIAMVTSYSVDEMWQSYDKYAEMAAELGQTTESVIQSSALFYQQGLDTAEALELTTSTMKLATLANADFKTATSQMTAALRGFHMEMSEGEHVTDVYSELAAHAAADVNGIAYAMSKTSSIAASAGMSFETTAAFLTQMIETTQEAPENLGTAMKTIIARFTELKNNVSATESEFEDLDYNKVDTALKSVGVALKDSMGQFRNLDDVFLELSEKWNTLDRNQQRYIATTAAGSRQQSRFLALMENYDRTLELIETAQNSAGRSSQQFAKYQDTVESKIKKLKTTWEQLRVRMLDPNAYKGAIEALTKIVEKLNKMDFKQIASIGVVFATIGKTLVTNLISSIQQSSSSIMEAITNPFEVGRRQISQLMIDGTTTTVNAIKQQYSNLSSQLITTLSNSGVVITSGLLTSLNGLNSAAQQTVIEYVEGNRELDKEIQKLEELKQKERDRNVTESQIETSLYNQTTELGKQQKKIEEINAQQASRRAQLASAGLTDTSGLTTTGGAGTDASIWKGALSSIGSSFVGAFSTGVTTALITSITAALSGSDVKDALKNSIKPALFAAAAQLIPSLISTLLPKLLGTLLSTAAGPIALAVGAAALGAMGIAWALRNKALDEAKSFQKQAEEDFEKTKEKYTTMLEISDAEEDKINDQKKKIKNLEEEVNRYKELKIIANKTVEEQEEYNELVESLKEELPELKNFYDERNNALTISNAKLDEMIDKEKEIAARNTALSTGAQITGLQLAQKAAIEEDRIRRSDLNTARIDERDYLDGHWAEHNLAMNKHRKEWMAQWIDENTTYEGEWVLDKNNTQYNNEKVAAVREQAFQALKQHLDQLDKDYVRESLQLIEERDKKLAEIEEEIQKARLRGIDEEFSDSGQYTRDYLKRHATINKGENFIEDVEKNVKLDNVADEQLAEWELSRLPNLQAELIKIFDNDLEAMTDYYEKAKTLGKDWLITDIANREAALKDYKDTQELKDQHSEEFWQKYEDDVSEMMSLPYKEFIEALYDTDWGEELNLDKKEIRKEYFEKRNEILEQSGLQDLLQNGIFDEEQLKKLTNEELQSLNNFAEDKIKEFGHGTAERYLNGITTALKDTDISDITQMVNWLNWDNVDSTTLDTYREEFIDWYKQNLAEGLDPAEARKQAEQYFNQIKAVAQETNLYDPLISSFETFGETMSEKYEELEKQADLMNQIYTSKSPVEVESKDVDSYQEMLDKLYELKVLNDKLDADSFFEWDEEKGVYLAKTEELKNIWEQMTKETVASKALEDLQLRQEQLRKEIGKQAEQEKTISKEKLEQQKLYEETETVLEKINKGEELTKEDWEIIEKYSKETGNDLNKILQDSAREYREIEKIVKGTARWHELIQELIDDVSSLISSFKSAALEQVEDGKITASTYKSLADDIKEINKLYGVEKLRIEDYVDAMGKFDWQKYEADLKAYIELLKAEGKEVGYLERALADLRTAHDDIITKQEELAKVEEETTEAVEEENDALERQQELEDKVKEATENVTKAQEDLKQAEEDLAQAQEAVAKAYEDIAEKEQKVLEIQEELNEAMYGTGSRRKSTLDGMYNYDQLLKQINNDLTDVKQLFEDPDSVDQIGGAVAQYSQLMHSKKATLLGEQASYQLGLAKTRSLLEPYSKFYSEVNGRLLVDVARLNAAAMPDKIKDSVESIVNTYNDQVDKLHDITSQIKSLEKEFADFQSTYRDKFISLQEKVISSLRETAQEELNVTKEKYSALEEADNEYTMALEEAINKQRELRNEANEEQDLAQKEKKLSLMERDTSGANQKDILKQRDEVDKTRQNLNDKKIDSIVKSLKDLYSSQKKSRDAEIKYMEAVLDNATYIEEANAVISSWQTADEMVSWFYEHSQDVQNMTNEQLIQYSETLRQSYLDMNIYTNTTIKDFTDAMQVTQAEVNAMTSNVTETMSTEAERAFKEIQKDVEETIDSIRLKLGDAQRDVESAKEALAKALDEVSQSVTKVKTATQQLASARQMLAEATALAVQAQKEYNEVMGINTDTTSTRTDGVTVVTGGNTGDTSGGSSSSNTFYDKLSAKDKERVNGVLENYYKEDGYWWADSKNYPEANMDTFMNAVKEKVNKGSVVYGKGSNGILYIARNSDIITKADNTVTTTHKYKKGGLVNYTGPAWVDGTPANPEAFLSAEDTRNIARLTDVLGSLYSSLNNFNTPSAAVSNNNTVINVSVNVDGISSDYDVDRAVEKVKQSIVDAANQVGSTVILYQ